MRERLRQGGLHARETYVGLYVVVSGLARHRQHWLAYARCQVRHTRAKWGRFLFTDGSIFNLRRSGWTDSCVLYKVDVRTTLEKEGNLLVA